MSNPIDLSLDLIDFILIEYNFLLKFHFLQLLLKYQIFLWIELVFGDIHFLQILVVLTVHYLQLTPKMFILLMQVLNISCYFLIESAWLGKLLLHMFILFIEFGELGINFCANVGEEYVQNRLCLFINLMN